MNPIEQQSTILLGRDSLGKTALQYVGSAEVAEVLLENLTPEQRLQCLSIQDKEGDRVIHTKAQQAENNVMHRFLNGLTPD